MSAVSGGGIAAVKPPTLSKFSSGITGNSRVPENERLQVNT